MNQNSNREPENAYDVRAGGHYKYMGKIVTCTNAKQSQAKAGFPAGTRPVMHDCEPSTNHKFVEQEYEVVALHRQY